MTNSTLSQTVTELAKASELQCAVRPYETTRWQTVRMLNSSNCQAQTKEDVGLVLVEDSLKFIVSANSRNIWGEFAKSTGIEHGCSKNTML